MMRNHVSQASVNQPNLYDRDYSLWLQTTANQLRERKFSEVDVENLADEIESMGRREKSALSSNLQVVLMHLLKYRYQPNKRTNSWLLTIFEHRDRVEEALELSPSLKPYLEEIFSKCYSKARKKAALETGLPIDSFPKNSPFTLEETLDVDYLPED